MLNYAQNIETAKNALVAHSYYQSALDLFEFDSWQALPKNGRAFRGSTAAFMSEQAGALLRTPQIRRTADFFRRFVHQTSFSSCLCGTSGSYNYDIVGNQFLH